MNTLLVRMSTSGIRVGLAMALTVLLSACATMPEETDTLLSQAERQVEQARLTPAVAQYAPRDLQRAETSLEEARSLWEEEGRDEKAAVEHHAYLAKQRAETALQRAALGEARAEIDRASEERETVLRQARERELQAAQRQVERAETRAQAVEERYRSRQQAQQATEARQGETQQLQELRETVESLQAQQTERGTVLTLDQVLFDFGESQLNPGGERALQQLAQYLQQDPNRQVLVEGYTDSIGDEDFNRQLSQERADAVRDQLLAQGISSDRIEIQGHGEQYPIATNDTSAGRQLNRRVEVVVGNGQKAPEPRNTDPASGAQSPTAEPEENQGQDGN